MLLGDTGVNVINFFFSVTDAQTFNPSLKFAANSERTTLRSGHPNKAEESLREKHASLFVWNARD